MRDVSFLLILSLLCLAPAIAQSPNATINGIVLDPSGAAIAGAQIIVVNDATSVQHEATTNSAGIYVVTNLPPGPYRIQVAKIGFKTIIKPDIVLNVQDALAINFTLPIGAVSEIVTVTGGTPLVNTQDAAVSTVVDRQFAENLPMNGRTFQTLIQLTPGVVLASTNNLDAGQFSINGQRTSSNYWMVDGVSANIGVGASSFPGSGLAGSLGSFSALGGTNSLVSADAMQEFRILTSTYAPEFGRTPGGQISVVTRSGTNRFQGTAFDYVRNDFFDANNWFNTAITPALSKAEERQNDFGGTLGGPILKDRTFFFFSYEGLRLRLPQTNFTTVPDNATVNGGLDARGTAKAAMQPYLNAYPMPNGPEVFASCKPASDPTCPPSGQKPTGAAQFNASFSNKASLDAYSLRLDHKLNHELTLLGRYNYSPSNIVVRGGGLPLSVLAPNRITTQTATVGATWAISATASNDFRFNYSRTEGQSSYSLDNFGGAVPLASPPFPSPFTNRNARFFFAIASLSQGFLREGSNARNLLRQFNVVDNLSQQKAAHGLKLGVDYRRVSPVYDPELYQQFVFFFDVPSAGSGSPFFNSVTSNNRATLLFKNLGLFVQDTWRIFPRFTLTYGLRWDVDFAPSSLSGPSLPAVTGFNLNSLAQLSLAPAGTPPFRTPYGNLAPRLGGAYQLSQSPEWGTVLRGGFGVFYDLATSETGNLVVQGYPFSALKRGFRGTFPLDPAAAAPPAITPASLSSGTLGAFDPQLRLPYTLEWNVGLEQSLGEQQVITASYVAAVGRRLIQSAFVNSPNSNFGSADLVSNTATSDYQALQLQFQRRLLKRLQVLASYTWSHAIDTGSAGSYANGSNTLVPAANPNQNRGPSDFDIRNTFSVGTTYDIPAPKINPLTEAILRGWSLQNVIQVRSSTPVNVWSSSYGFGQLLNATTQVRPDVVPGMPFFLHGAQYPGGKAINPAAFTSPSVDPNTGAPLRQGDLGRNALRGFGAAQWDLSIHRDFPIHELLKLQFRAELFNVLNHPNFGSPVADLSSKAHFGQATQMLGQSLAGAGNLGAGALNPLYQIGGPRSIQLALKLTF